MESGSSFVVRLLFSFACAVIGFMLSLVAVIFTGVILLFSGVIPGPSPLPHFWIVEPIAGSVGFVTAFISGFVFFGRRARKEAR